MIKRVKPSSGFVCVPKILVTNKHIEIRISDFQTAQSSIFCYNIVIIIFIFILSSCLAPEKEVLRQIF